MHQGHRAENEGTVVNQATLTHLFRRSQVSMQLVQKRCMHMDTSRHPLITPATK